MSQTSPREEAAAQTQYSASQFQKQLTDVSYPELQQLLGSVQTDMAGGFNSIPSSVTSAFAPAFAANNATYSAQEGQAGGVLGQRAKQGGMNLTSGQLSDTTRSAISGLEQNRAQGNRNLKFEEASAGLTQYNSLIQALGGGARTALGLGSGGLGLELGAEGGMSNTSQFGSTLGGAAEGASLGSSVYPGWGTVIGGALGGLYGAFSGG